MELGSSVSPVDVDDPVILGDEDGMDGVGCVDDGITAGGLDAEGWLLD